jgi:serine/threonine-protein kinase BUR1
MLIYREVHKAVHKPTRRVVALKRILMHNEKEGMPVTALREIKILKALKHPCIVNILDMFVVRSMHSCFSMSTVRLIIFTGAGSGEGSSLSVYMVFPYMDHDLAGLLENERVKLQPSHIKLYMKQLLEGTEYMHQVSHLYTIIIYCLLVSFLTISHRIIFYTVT